MKVLLDENLPKGLKRDFPGHEIFTVRDKDWTSKKNGELIRLMIDEGFDILITFDQNITFQQNLNKYPICLIVLRAQINTYEVLKKFVPEIRSILSGQPGKRTIILE
jgi:predicted nuclease of predicted toxin-antitoxin system